MIYISGHFVYSGRVGGAEQMLYNLLRGFAANGTGISVICSDEKRFDPAFMHEDILREVSIIANNSPRKRFISEQISCFDPKLRSDAILFPNYFTPPVIPRRFGRVATVIHDFLFTERWNVTPRARRVWQTVACRMTYARADAVIVPSEFVRNRARQLYGSIGAKKTVTIPNPVSWQRFGELGGEVPYQGRPYILTVAARYPHKNLEVLIRAFARLRSAFPDLLLVLAGQLPAALLGIVDRCDRISKLIAELGLESGVKSTGYINDPELARLYRNATIFAFPSLFEGFGMPPVEALGLGLPTLTTRAASVPEVTMGAAHYLDDARDVGEWTTKLADVLRNPTAYKPPPAVIAEIRERYEPKRIAALYERALLGTDSHRL